MQFNCSSPSSSSQSEDDSFPEMTATQLLSVAIQKRRALYSSKERDFRKELLHTSIIQSLCKHLGEGRARRRRRGGKKRSRSHSTCRGDNQVCDAPVAEKSCFDPTVQTPLAEPSAKRSRLEVSSIDDKDPFGLDELFASVFGRPALVGNDSMRWDSLPVADQDQAVTAG